MSADAVRGILRHPLGSPTVETIARLARALDTSPEWLAFGIGEPISNRAFIPLVTWVSAGAFQPADTVVDLSEFPIVEIAGLPDGEWFALTVEGDSMNRISPPGSIIAVNRRDRRLIPNGCYIIQNEEGEVTYKRYRPAPERFEPVSTNDDHPSLFPSGAIKVIGRVRRSILDM